MSFLGLKICAPFCILKRKNPKTPKSEKPNRNLEPKNFAPESRSSSHGCKWLQLGDCSGGLAPLTQ